MDLHDGDEWRIYVVRLRGFRKQHLDGVRAARDAKDGAIEEIVWKFSRVERRTSDDLS